MKLSTQYLSGHQCYTLCAKKKKMVPSIGGPKITSEWRHVWAVSMQNNDLHGSPSCTQLLRFNQFICIVWHTIDRYTELLCRIFKILKRKKMMQKFPKKCICKNYLKIFCFRTNGRDVTEPININQFWNGSNWDVNSITVWLNKAAISVWARSLNSWNLAPLGVY